MNPSALTALVDRWRPETHTFHLRAGEMAPTLQDVSMILALPIQGEPLCMNTASDGWRQQMEGLIGRAPPAPENPKQRVPAGASFEWIRTNFGECPIEADEDTRRTYARVYLWYMISRTLFPDSGGKLAHWCWLKALTVLDDRWSWGTAALAYLYRQLDEACRRTGSKTGSGGIGGCMLLLSVRSWDRLSVGRPRVLNETPWPHFPHFPDREPTWAYLWDNVPEMTSDPMVMYRQYTAELDTLTAEQVEWEPYGSYYHIGAGMADLNPKCTEEARFWHCASRLTAFNNYLEWFHQNTRIELVKRAYREEILDDPIQFDEVGQSQHDTFARRGRSTSIASELNFVREEIQKTAEECEVMWEKSGRDEKPVGPLRNFIKNTARKMRRLANLLGCREGEIPTSSSSEEHIPPEDDLILSQGILPKRTSKQRSAYQLKPRGKAPNRYTPEDYVNRGKKVFTEEDDGRPRRSAMSRMRNDEPFSSDEEEEEEEAAGGAAGGAGGGAGAAATTAKAADDEDGRPEAAHEDGTSRTLLGCATCCSELYIHKYRFVNPMYKRCTPMGHSEAIHDVQVSRKRRALAWCRSSLFGPRVAVWLARVREYKKKDLEKGKEAATRQTLSIPSVLLPPLPLPLSLSSSAPAWRCAFLPPGSATCPSPPLSPRLPSSSDRPPP
ncbi:hypothetical protein QYE76_065938 [Lolium multiflorum]|uniref:Aminotransferase-like plant mobile domain-containing protein n=1 Tax=Lolium multiflorum TaxID=4521 RepID=A0AAD8SBA2_LOLMU|nr:hypothetical protein QYE76_065938 [Lolium multiflorum]